MLASLILVVILSLLNVGTSFILGSYLLSGIVGFVYPAYASFKALETENKDDDRRCLVYWTVYAFCQLFDPVLSFCLSFVPAFYFIKVMV
jgi:receptor expression-enhancing protein 5/6